MNWWIIFGLGVAAYYILGQRKTATSSVNTTPVFALPTSVTDAYNAWLNDPKPSGVPAEGEYYYNKYSGYLFSPAAGWYYDFKTNVWSRTPDPRTIMSTQATI